jgi:hypothetical protein
LATDKIDSIVDRAAVTQEIQFLKDKVAEFVAAIKATKEQAIDLNINTKTIADYNKKLADLEKQIGNVQKTSNEATKASILLAKQREAEAKATERAAKATQAEERAKQSTIKTTESETRAREKDMKVVYDSVKAKQIAEATAKNLEKQQQQIVKQLQAEEKALADASNDYLQLSKAYNDAALKAKNYALQLGETHPVTIAAVADAKTYGDTLKRLDATVGQHQRNVGNYTQATFALTQVLREAPAFANSFATGISAIGNNVPMLVDQFKLLRTEVGSNFKALAILGKSLFSFTALLPIGFLLLQSFGKEVVNFTKGLFGAADAAERSEKYLNKFNNTIETGRARITALAESIQFLNTVGKINLEIDFGEGFELKDLQAQSVGIATQIAAIGSALSTLQTEADGAFNKFMEGIITEEAYTKASEKSTERRKELQKDESRLNREQIILYRQIALERVKIQREKEKKDKDTSEKERKDAMELFKFRMQLLIDEQKNIVAIGSGRTRDNARRKQAQLELQLIKGVSDFELREKEITSSKIKLINLKRQQDEKDVNRHRLLDIMSFAVQEREALAESAEETSRILSEKQKEIDEKAAEDLLDTQINGLLAGFKARTEVIEDNANIELQNNLKRYKKGEISKNQFEQNKLRIENDARRKSLTDEIDYQISLVSLSKLSEDEKKKAIERLRAIRQEIIKMDLSDEEKAAEKSIAIQKARRDALIRFGYEARDLVFDLLNNSLEREKNAIQDQIDLLEKQKQKDIEVANQTIVNASDRADAIAIIEARAAAKKAQLELKQRQLDQQKARFEKANAVTRIIQETAVAVIGSFKTDPTGILAAIIAAIGAAQLVRVIAQPIPRYAEGTDNHKGGPMYVGDGGRSEGVVMPDGSVYKSPATATLVNAPAGTKVFKDYDKMMLDSTMTKVPVFNIKTVDNTEKLMKGFSNVVKAVKGIPQPTLISEGSWKRAMRNGSSYRTYLNRNL